MNNTYLYWGSTLLIALFAALTGVLYFVAQAPAETIARLGYPEYVRVLLGIGKLAGAVGLLVPLPRFLKEWVYAGFTIDFSMAIISHAVVGDPLSVIVRPVVALAVLWTSYAAYHAYVLADADSADVSA